MKKNILCFAVSFCLTYMCMAQTVLYSESFETNGEGVRYFSNTFSFCSGSPGNNPDYFLRTNTNPVTPTGCTLGFADLLTNLQGSWFWASEDVRSSSPVVNGNPPGQITTSSINTSAYANLKVSLYLATSSNNNVRWESADSINIQASFDGVNYATVGRFMGDAVSGGRLRIDGNLDGAITGADPVTTCDQLNFTKYTFNIPGTGASLRIRLDYDQIGGTEELGVDLIEVTGASTLPVKLLYFNAGLSASNEMVLNWKIDEASDASYFDVEKSSNGRDFYLLKKIIAGNERLYTITDSNTVTAISFYRLKLIDKSGAETYSKVVSVTSNKQGSQTATIFPNPAIENTILSFISPVHSTGHIALYSFDGKMAMLIPVQLSTGVVNLPVNISRLTRGIYFARVTNGEGLLIATSKLMKQ